MTKGHHAKVRGGAIPTLVTVDPHAPGNTQRNIHTRWHPDIPYVSPAVGTQELTGRE